jgi:uncharacterized protein
MFWLYLLVIGATELLILLSNSIVGVVLYALLLASLVIHSALARASERQQLARALLLLPLMRILALTLPLALFPPLARYPIVGVPLLVAAWIVVRQSELTRADLGLQAGHPLQQLMLGGAGIAIGALEYAILQPQPLIATFSWDAMLLGALIVFVFIGFVEELIFRGLLLRLASATIGRFAVIYVALLFAALSLGYGSLAQAGFVFGIALLFGSIVRWTSSILGVVLAHGLSSVMLYLVIPYAIQHPTSAVAQNMPWAIAIGIGLAVGALAMLVLDSAFGRRALQPAALVKIAANWSSRRAAKAPANRLKTSFARRPIIAMRRKIRSRRVRRQRKIARA